MSETASGALEKIFAYCKHLDADVRYHPEQGYLTVLVHGSWRDPLDLAWAISVQDEIQQQADLYLHLVCYRFDPFSTLVYTV